MNRINLFNSASYANSGNSEKRPKPAPFSLRLTIKEKALLRKRAGERPLGAYIKSELFKKRSKAGTDFTLKDKAQLLAKLGASGIGPALTKIARSAEIGALPVTPELEEELHAACKDIRIIRKALMRALGFRED